jgi:outer membrane protein assembly factor BamB
MTLSIMKRGVRLLAGTALAAALAFCNGACDEKKSTQAPPAAPPSANAPATTPAGAAAAAPAAPAVPAGHSPAVAVAANTPPAHAAVNPAAPSAPVLHVEGGFTIDVPPVPHGEWPMLFGTPHRNSISPEKNPPTDWDVTTGKNILWSAILGSKSYGNPIVAQGIVTIGTNNGGPRDPNNTADAGVEMAFDATTGKYLWQKVYSKLPTGRVNDWPGEGLCSTAYSEPGKLWYCTNQCHVVCLDLSPGAPKMPDGSPPVIWDYDMIDKLAVFPHNMTSSSIAAYGDLIYVITGNGVDDTHKNVVSPDAPGIVCFDKNTGKVVWTDNSPGKFVLHGQWASVAIVELNGRAMVLAPLGDAWIYAFDAKTGKIIWKFDCNPKDSVYPTGTRNNVIATPCVVGKYMYIANGQDPEHGEGAGHMYCVDITGQGDVSLELDADPGAAKPRADDGDSPVQPPKGKPNPNSKCVWHFDVAKHAGKIGRGEHMMRTISTAVVTPEGLCFVPDFSGFFHCFDAKTGEHLWSYDMEAAMWGSPLYADGKLFVCDGDGNVRIFKATRQPPVKNEIITRDMGNSVWGDHLVAIKDGVQGAPLKSSESRD